MKQFFAALVTCCLLLNLGCENQKDLKTAKPDDLKPIEDDHHHEHTAPHGGHLIELGDHKYNAEIVYSAADPKLTMYFLGAHAEAPVAIPDKEVKFQMEVEGAMKELVFKAEPATGDESGKSSKFVLADPASLPSTIDSIEEIHGVLTISINGENFTGNLTHTGEKHDDHAHEHGKEEMKKEDTKKTEPANTEKHDDHAKEEMKKEEPKKEEPAKTEPPKEEMKKEEPKPAETPKTETPKTEEPKKEEVKKEETK